MWYSVYNFLFSQLPDAIAIDVGDRLFGPGVGAIFLDNVGCRGNETNLGGCPHRGIGNSNCDHNEDAGVICPQPGWVPLLLWCYTLHLCHQVVCPELYRCWQFLVSMPHSVLVQILHRNGPPMLRCIKAREVWPRSWKVLNCLQMPKAYCFAYETWWLCFTHHT